MTSLFEGLITEFEVFFKPLVDAAEKDAERRQLFSAIGLDLSESESANLQSRFDELKSAYQSLSQLADGSGGESMTDIRTALEAVENVFTGLDGIESDLPEIDETDVLDNLTDYLVLRYLFVRRPTILQALVLLTVVDVPPLEERNAGPRNQPTIPGLPSEASLEFDQVGKLLSEPEDTLLDAYAPEKVTAPSEAARIARLLFPPLARITSTLGFRIAYGTQDMNLPDYGGVTNLTVASKTLTMVREFQDIGVVGARIALASSEDGLSLYVVPFGAASADLPVGEWSFSLSMDAGLDVIVINPGGIAHASPQGGELQGEVGIEKTGSADSNAAVLGPTEGTRLELGTLGVFSDWRLSSDTTEVGVEGRAGDSSLIIQTGNADSFLKTILPKDGVSADFDLGLGWSNQKGVHLEGSGSLDAHHPLHLSFGEALTVDALDVSVSAGDGSIPVSMTTTPNVEFGPVAVAIEGVGLRADFAFPEGVDGNLGPVDLGFGFKPPSGIALSINAGTVTGGGYLSFDPEKERYTGAISLDIGKLTLNAVGLLTTELPDGSDGFSLLVVITGEFPPVQLGLGFTLNSVGGLLGVNRSAQVSALRSSVRDGSLESLLFPQDPLSNIPRLVSDLRGFFPATKDQHVFGPMAKIGWGTPSIIKADLGVILELPSPLRLLVLGRLSAVLPDDDAAILQLQMNAFGVINFTEQKASLDASLYDSRVTTFPLTGNMAMRTDWGDNPGFGLSVGGWNPRFEPPESFPALDRVAVNLTDGNNPRLRLAGYFAVTSNTVQVGAAVDLYAAAAGFSVDGHLGFDALFQFDPFKFVVDVGASVAFKHGNTTLMSVSFDGTLSGPTPWHARGKASIDILFFEASVSFNAKFGSSSQPGGMPPADVLPKLTAAVGDRRNWTAQMPETDASFVRLREIEPGDGDVLAHPLGQLGFRQRVVPLGVRIEKYGSAKPADYNTFSIGAVRTVALTGGETTENQTHDRGDLRANFAPDQYFELSDSERLSRPSFEKLPAGEVVASDDLAFGGMDDEPGQGVESHARTRTLKYESHYIDEDKRKKTKPEKVVMARTTADSLAEVSAVATGEARNSGRKSFAGPDQSVPVADVTYVVASVTDLRQRIDSGLPETGTTYVEAEQALETYRADHAVDTLQVVASHEAREPEEVMP